MLSARPPECKLIARRFARLLLPALLCACVAAVPAQAANTAQGLVVSPVREYITTSPKKPSQYTLTLTNQSESVMSVALTVQKFTVSDYSYNYQFKDTTEQWIAFSQDVIALEPQQSQKIDYTLTAPLTTTPGGHYLTVLATATLNNGLTKAKLQAATLLYVTVSGNVIQKSIITDSHMPRFAFGDITFTLTAKNTGNTHMFSYIYGELHGLSAQPRTTEVAHLLMPGTNRSFSSTIPAPLLPGVYKATYGYTTDTNQHIELWQWIIYLPPWSIALGLGLLWVGFILIRAFIRSRRKRRFTTDS